MQSAPFLFASTPVIAGVSLYHTPVFASVRLPLLKLLPCQPLLERRLVVGQFLRQMIRQLFKQFSM